MGKDSLEKKGFQILGQGLVYVTDVIHITELKDGDVVGVGLANNIRALGVGDTLVGDAEGGAMHRGCRGQIGCCQGLQVSSQTYSLDANMCLLRLYQQIEEQFKTLIVLLHNLESARFRQFWDEATKNRNILEVIPDLSSKNEATRSSIWWRNCTVATITNAVFTVLLVLNFYSFALATHLCFWPNF